jgi:hypothetical protein
MGSSIFGPGLVLGPDPEPGSRKANMAPQKISCFGAWKSFQPAFLIKETEIFIQPQNFLNFMS